LLAVAAIGKLELLRPSNRWRTRHLYWRKRHWTPCSFRAQL